MKIALHTVPKEPGIYRFFNKKRDIIYIGKAKNLKSRVSSYFHKGSELSPAKLQMVAEIADFDYIAVNTETEALLLEAGLIKKYLPPYNIVLRDDKNWTYIVITDEAFPRIITVHGRKKMKGKFFGPYTSGAAARTLVRLLHQVIPLRTCKRDLSKLPNGLVCMQYHLGRCLGPCEKIINTQQYDALIAQAEKILKGNGTEIYDALKAQMQEASRKQQFEKAVVLRNKIQAWEHVFRPQHIESSVLSNHDVINAVAVGPHAIVTVLQVRDGKITDKYNYQVDNPLQFEVNEIIENFLTQYYAPPNIKPREIIIPFTSASSLERALAPAELMYAQRGIRRKLLDVAQKNARLHFQKLQNLTALPPVLFEMQRALKLTELPLRIECYDISNISGQYAVGAMVVMKDGKLTPSEYRKFRIKTVEGPNDVAMMREMLERRQRHTEWPEPNLIVLDGGKPQLSTVYPILQPAWKAKLVALAKKQEEIFVPGRALSIQLPKNNPASLLLQRLRNSTHRQAIMYYRLLHKKEWKKSAN